MDARRAARRTLALDRAAVEAIEALHAGDVPAVLLRGRSYATWLYHPSEVRYATDVDLLVPPDRFDVARTVLEELGYEPVFAPGDDLAHAVMHGRDDGAHVDLHRSLYGLGAPPARVWDALSRHTAPLRLLGEDVTRLDEVGRCLAIAVHAGSDESPGPQARQDLQRALRSADESVWREATQLATDLGGTDAFTEGLGTEPAGAELASRLELEALAPSIDLPRGLDTLVRLTSADGLRATLRSLVGALARRGRR